MARKPKHADPTRYMVWVLWLCGHSQTAIAEALTLRRKQVAGIVDRMVGPPLELKKREAMTWDERRALVEEMRAWRDDEGRPFCRGRLKPAHFKVLPLRGESVHGIAVKAC